MQALVRAGREALPPRSGGLLLTLTSLDDGWREFTSFLCVRHEYVRVRRARAYAVTCVNPGRAGREALTAA